MSNSSNSRNTLFSNIWKILNKLRCQSWESKEYILGFMFYYYLSNYICNHINEIEKKWYPNFSYSNLSDDEISDEAKKQIISEIGFFIYPSELFSNVYNKYENDYENLNEALNSIFINIESSTNEIENYDNFKGLFKIIDLNNEKLGLNPLERNKFLIKIISEINNWDLDDPKNHNIDIFGDAYEYLISMYSSKAGKKGGNILLRNK